MISAKRRANGTLQVLNGHMRLRAQLEIHGQAEIVDIDTGKPLLVHEVDGQMVALSDDAQANLEDLATAATNRART